MSLPDWANGGSPSLYESPIGGWPIATSDVYPGNPDGENASFLSFDDGRQTIAYIPGQNYTRTRVITPSWPIEVDGENNPPIALRSLVYIDFGASGDDPDPLLQQKWRYSDEEGASFVRITDAFAQEDPIILGDVDEGFYTRVAVKHNFIPLKVTYYIRTFDQNGNSVLSDLQEQLFSVADGWEHDLEPAAGETFLDVRLTRLLPFTN